jgi:glycerol kinase
MNSACILAIDQGTTNTKAVLVDTNGSITALASRPLRVSYPQPTWVEQDAIEIWQSVESAIAEVLASSPHAPVAIGISNQRETIVLWDRASGKPLGPAVVWQCHRSAAFCHELTQRGYEPFLRERTGLTIDPMFSASKAAWLLANTPNGYERAAAGELCLGTIDSWLLWNLTGGQVHACDLTNASRTQLLNLHTLAWDTSLAELFGVPLAALPTVRASGAEYGVTIAHPALPAGIPITSMIGDSHAALFGHGMHRHGIVKATYGTGSSLMAPTPQLTFSQHGLSSTIAWARNHTPLATLPADSQRNDAHATSAETAGQPFEVTYALEGNIYATGAAVQWLADFLALPDGAAGIERLATQAADAGGIYLVPAFVGLGAPHWNDQARGLICGLVGGSTQQQLARATLEAIAYQIRDLFEALAADLGTPAAALLADGGASRNDLLMQIQADLLGYPVIRSAATELSALGAAWLAGLTIGFWPSEDAIRTLIPAGSRFEPTMPADLRASHYHGWQQAIARAVQQ